MEKMERGEKERLGCSCVRDRKGREREEIKERRKRKRKEKGGKGLKRKKKGANYEVEGPLCEKQKTEKCGCKRQGVGKENCQGETLGFEVRWALGRGWATLSQFLKTFLF